MASFSQAITTVLQNEGVLSNNPTDKGGLTKFGISQAAYPNVDIAALTIADAEVIYQRDYWRFDSVISQAVATKLLDMSVNLGQGTAIKLLQQSLNYLGANIVVDGVWGSKTLSTLNGSSETEVLTELRAMQSHYYTVLVAQKPEDFVFLQGWLRRAAQ